VPGPARVEGSQCYTSKLYVPFIFVLHTILHGIMPVKTTECRRVTNVTDLNKTKQSKTLTFSRLNTDENVYYHCFILVVMQFAGGLLYTSPLIIIALCYILITHFMFLLFDLCSFPCFFMFCFLVCVFCVFVLFCFPPCI
jgi:hypothetical protein